MNPYKNLMEMAHKNGAPLSVEMGGYIAGVYILLREKRKTNIWLSLWMAILLFGPLGPVFRLLFCMELCWLMHSIWSITRDFHKYPKFVMVAKALTPGL